MDPLETLYCLRCRKPISKEISDAGRGLCPSCETALRSQRQNALVAAERSAVAREQQQDAERRAFYAVNTGRGRCPSCGSFNIRDVAVTEDDSAEKQTMACLLGLFCLWPLLIIAPLLGSRRTTYHRMCNFCGNAWPI